MTINEVSASEYVAAISSHPHIFNTPAFASLNAHKVDAVHHLLFESGGKARFGLIVGERNGMLLTPFSAPFGGFSVNHAQRMEYVDEAVQLLCQYAKQQQKDVRVVLPPEFYDRQLITSSISALSRFATLQYIDVNYHFRLEHFKNYEARIDRAARKNLHRAMDADFEFKAICRDDIQGIHTAYDVIRRNRQEHGYPLRMSLNDVMQTIGIIPADFFVMTYKGEEVAAAQVFHVAKGIAQVIYWGDLRSYSHLRPMNYFTYRLFEHYSKQGIEVLDIGPSTEEGKPNYGLCDFKTAIGCEMSPKFVFVVSATE